MNRCSMINGLSVWVRAVWARAIVAMLAAILVFLFAISAWAEMLTVRVKTANFREAPTESAAILFTADRHYPVKVVERKRGWVKVKDFEGEIAWIAERLLARNKGVVIIVEKATLRAKPEDNAASVAVAAWSDSFAVKQVRAEWVLVESAGVEGWVRRSVVWGLDP